jgi:myosin heavy subunit
MYHFILSVLCVTSSVNTDSTVTKLPEKYLSQVTHKSHQIEEQVSKRTDQALDRFAKQEKKMQAKLWKVDSVAAKNIFTRSIDKLNGLKNKVPSGVSGNADLDTLQNSLKFLDGSKDLLGSSKDKLSSATQSVQDLQGKLQQAEEVKAYIRERRQQLKEQLSQYTGFTKDLQNMNKEAYYYGQQLNEYKSLLKDKKKAEAKGIELLKKMPAYNDFIQKHSQLASLFNLSAAANTAQSLEGLQTRAQVEQLVQQRMGGSPSAQQAVSQQMEQARSQFNELKSKFPELDNAGDMPDFKPNPMKTKSFLQRLEFGGNVQFQKSSKYFPTTTDIAGQVAYKFNKNGSIGVGISYKLGLGTGWNDIAISHQGVGLRSFVDWKLKGTFFINGGFEENYLSAFSHINQLASWKGWQGSALLGISKKYKISAKLKGNIMVLYDFLASRNTPPTSPLKVRLGYNF